MSYAKLARENKGYMEEPNFVFNENGFVEALEEFNREGKVFVETGIIAERLRELCELIGEEVLCFVESDDNDVCSVRSL